MVTFVYLIIITVPLRNGAHCCSPELRTEKPSILFVTYNLLLTQYAAQSVVRSTLFRITAAQHTAFEQINTLHSGKLTPNN